MWLYSTLRQTCLLLAFALTGATLSILASDARASSDGFPASPPMNASGQALAPAADGLPTASGFAQDDFLPVDQAYRLQVALLDGRPLIRWTIADGYYLYRHQLDFQWRPPTDAPAEPAGADWQHGAELPAGVVKDDPYFGRVETYYRELSVMLAPLPGPGMLTIRYQGCADGGLCYPPQTAYFEVDPAVGTVATAAAPAPPDDGIASGAGAGRSLIAVALLAALGGMLLNLMPCVFPVLSLKVLSFAEDRQHSLASHGLSYTAGVMLSFIAVALLMLILAGTGRAVGWGFQLQSPVFIGLLTYLFLALGLSLSGFWSLGNRWMGLGQGLAMRRGHSGSFFTGALAVVVASPCTAPFMGTALGFASTQPALPALAVFAALGFGMALPVLLLCLFPGWLNRLPQPGPWMDHLKHLLAFPLYATAVWLAWVVGRQAGVDAMAALLGGALLIALALWLWRFGPIARGAAAVALVAALAVVTGPLLTAPGESQIRADNAGFEAYSAERLAALRAAGTPVFLNVTADWCLTCLANERVALSSAPVREAFAQAGAVYMKADWTRYDPAITALLAEYGRNGVPLYLWFAAGRPAELLPQLLTPGRVVSTVNGAG